MNDDTLAGLGDGTFRARWVREVLRTPHLTESIKLLLVAMAMEEMDAAGHVSVPRQELAVRIGRGKARISERLQEAVDSGFLVRVSVGKKGSTAVYAAALKGSACADLIETGKGPDTRTESEHFGSGLQDAIAEIKGPDTRTRTLFGSDLQDAIDDGSVRVGGPIDSIKGPPTRAAKVEESVREELPHTPEDEEKILRNGKAAARPARERAPQPAKISIPSDFVVTDDMRDWARDNCPLVDVGIETRIFVNYWLERPRTKRPGWVRSWENWMLRQQSWTKERHGNVRELRPTGTDTRFAPNSGSRAPLPTADDIANGQVIL